MQVAEVMTNVPVLRFPEFEGEWREKKLGEEVETSGYGPRFNANDYSENGNVKTIRGTDISLDGEILYDQVPIASLDKDFIKNHILEDGDLVIITTADCGLTGVFRKQNVPFIPSAYAVRLRLKKSSNPFLLKYYFQTQLAKNQVNSFVRKGTIGNLPGSDILKFSLSLPSLPEQQKIASFLTAMDEKIQQLAKKKALLEQYKKGVMQQIFSQQIRFKDDNGNEYPEWEEKKLSELGTTYNGLTNKSGEDFGSGKPYITYKQIFDNSRIDISRFEYVTITENERQSKVTYGDIFFTTSSETPNEVGYASVLLSKVEELYLNSFCFGFRPKSLDILYPKFSQYLFRSQLFRNNIIKLAQGSTRYNMSKTEFIKLSISIPSFSEQQKIASFLSAIDTKIEAVGKQIEATQTYKKGLLQQMFV
ncbi:restriction endonuclease subunit S [Cytophagaceae bacterium DM2B3-1]|uniref:Restriction endonuclease subunit S n=1 Tax=Xanthocytophaga flava TaxID=3048013 RepID=A0ABT7CIY1_9BACT|nr:restriction endonuclease subunit S [Xanthocytophaga flavus]MDJ1493678.1 restriction endonuclease subunit S [Xanthocytophaga flavus]